MWLQQMYSLQGKSESRDVNQLKDINENAMYILSHSKVTPPKVKYDN